MKTGEGKTLVATLPVYLNALTGKGVHVVTVNDYLARRDAEWMGPIYKFLGLTVGRHPARARSSTTRTTSPPDIRMTALRPIERREAYAADITYGTNNEFGFDYLRDNMKFALDELVQRELQLRDRRRGRLDPDRRGAHAADHLGPGRGVDRAVLQDRPHHPELKRAPPCRGQAVGDRGAKAGDFIVDEKAKHGVADRGRASPSCERLLGIENLYDPQHIDLLHHVEQALRAHACTSATSTTW